LIEGFFIFRPAVTKLRQTLTDLIEARENTYQANQALQAGYQELRIIQT